MRPAFQILSVTLLATMVAAPASRATWAPGGNPLCTAMGGQFASSAVTDGAGGAIVVFSDGQVFAQRVTYAGDIPPGWGPNGNPLCVAPGSHIAAHAASDGMGGAFVAWEDNRTDAADVYAQHILGSGALDPAWNAAGLPVAVGPVNQYVISMAADGVGGCFVVWQDDRNATTEANLDIYAQHLDAAGDALWTANGHVVCDAAGNQEQPRVMGDGVGGAYVAWQDWRNGRSRIYVHHLAANGSAASGWPGNGLALGNVGAFGDQFEPAIAPDGLGGVLIAWSGSNNMAVYHPFVQRVGASGALAPGWPAAGAQLCTLLQSQNIPQVVSDLAGGAIVVWRDFRDISNPNVNYHVYARRVNASGVPQWMTDGTPVCTAAGTQNYPAAVSDDQGGVVVAWEDARVGANGNDVYAMRLTQAGTRAAGWDLDGSAICTVAGNQNYPQLVPDGLSGAIVAWSDTRPAPRFQTPDVYAGRTLDDFVVPVVASLVSAVAQPDRVLLAWQVPGAGVAARVWRRALGGSWSAIGTAYSGGDGRVTFEDRDVQPGATYDYRLGLVQAGGEIFAGETRVTIPGAPGFALEGARPNPAVSELALAFSLPDGAPAVLELLDVGGRVIEARGVGDLGAGRHVVRLGAGRSIGPGLYWARLRRAGVSLTTRVAVVR